MDDFYKLVLADDSVNHFFADTDMEKQRRHQTAFICTIPRFLASWANSYQFSVKMRLIIEPNQQAGYKLRSSDFPGGIPMARSIQLTIHESRQELEHYLSNRRSATSKERLQMLYWLKRGIAKNRKELAQLLHRNEATISRWLLRYRSGGLAKLLEVKQAPGNRGKIPDEAVAYKFDYHSH